MSPKFPPDLNQQILMQGQQATARLRAQAEFEQRLANERINELLSATGSRIYAQLVSACYLTHSEPPTLEQLRTFAQLARDCAPVFGEALGVIRIQAKPDDPAADHD